MVPMVPTLRVVRHNISQRKVYRAAHQFHLKDLGQLEIAGTQVRDLLDAPAGVKHRRQQSVVTASLRYAAVDRPEKFPKAGEGDR